MKFTLPLILSLLVVTTITTIYFFNRQTYYSRLFVNKESDYQSISSQYNQLHQDYQNLASTDQIKINQTQQQEINSFRQLFKKLIPIYEDYVDLKTANQKIPAIETKFASIFKLISEYKYSEADSTLNQILSDIKTAQAKLAASVVIPANVPVASSAPGSGYNRVQVEYQGSNFLVDIISADLKTTKVVVDTASPSDCRNDCPVASLATFVSRSGGFAGINGPYFCPASYPSCVDKKNSFDTLLMNKDKTYFNSDNNVYSSVPAAIFSTTSRFVEASSQWGRDTSIDSVIAGQPLLVFNGSSRFGGDDDPKKSSVGNRSFIGATDNIVYIGVIRSATVAQAAGIIAKLGIKNAINLDSGGSTALMSGGKYLAGPGRDTPFGIVLVRR